VSHKLGDLLGAAGVKVTAETPAHETPRERDGLDFGGATKLVVRRDRKGRGGKTVTIVDGIRVAPSALERIARALRRHLGCGAHVEEGRLVVHGDLTARVEEWLVRHGAPKVVVGN
jgi:translation initiation factor 1